jgi:hypothetical protein
MVANVLEAEQPGEQNHDRTFAGGSGLRDH